MQGGARSALFKIDADRLIGDSRSNPVAAVAERKQERRLMVDHGRRQAAALLQQPVGGRAARVRGEYRARQPVPGQILPASRLDMQFGQTLAFRRRQPGRQIGRRTRQHVVDAGDLQPHRAHARASPATMRTPMSLAS